MEELRRQQTNTILRQERDAAITRETELVRLNGDLRSQNRKYREHVGVLLEELKDAWWRRAANAYAHLEAIHRDEIQ
jgi:FtsZ-binding cell division protein ZapB